MKKIRDILAWRSALEELYTRFNHSQFISSDPIAFVHKYKNPRDQEIVALIASSLAYGNVKQINQSVARVLDILGGTPYESLMGGDDARLAKNFKNFKHRWHTGNDLHQLLKAMRDVLNEHQSLENAFKRGLNAHDKDILPALSAFVDLLKSKTTGMRENLLPCPRRKSTCKRLHMFLRWMIRKDTIDLGVWKNIPTSLLIFPMDTHLGRVARSFGATQRKTTDIKTSQLITKFFRKFAPEDPVRYDFCLTRPGIMKLGEKTTKRMTPMELLNSVS